MPLDMLQQGPEDNSLQFLCVRCDERTAHVAALLHPFTIKIFILLLELRIFFAKQQLSLLAVGQIRNRKVHSPLCTNVCFSGNYTKTIYLFVCCISIIINQYTKGSSLAQKV